MEWSTNRRFLYGIAFLLFIALIAAYPVYKFLNPPPTCFDVKKNGTETGVDCGGTCALYCADQLEPLRVTWVDSFLVLPGRYDLGAYVENPNRDAGIKKLQYTFRVFDVNHKVLTERTNTTEVAPGTTMLIFEGDVNLEQTPSKVEISFNAEDLAQWVKAKKYATDVVTKNQVLKNTSGKPRFDVTLRNADQINDVDGLQVRAIIYGPGRKPIAISRTFVDRINKASEENIFFTWPSPFTNRSQGGMCSSPVDTVFAIDRSPGINLMLVAAQRALNSYLGTLTQADQVAVFSFGVRGASGFDQTLSSGPDAAKKVTDSFLVKKEATPEQVNWGDAVRVAVGELDGPQHNPKAVKAAIMFVSSTLNSPVDPENKKNAKYAEEYATMQAQSARDAGVEVFVIRLGKGAKESLLRDGIATDNAHYFDVTSADELPAIYKEISKAVCKEENFITDVVITPRAAFAR